MNAVRAEGFPPVWDENSRALILGSFPSVKSRAVGFYYGNPQNRFWRTVCGFFGESVPPDREGKRKFLLRRGIALWDIAQSCEIEGSSDASIRNATAAELPALLCGSRITRIFCNGVTAFRMLGREFPSLAPIATLLPSTSPANPRFSEEAWRSALREVFSEGEGGVRPNG